MTRPRLPAGLTEFPNPHRDSIIAYFGDAVPDLSAIPLATRFLFICFTNRCGSHFLAEALASSRRLNLAGEVLNAETVISESAARGHSDLGAYIGCLAREHAIGGWLVAKLAVTQLALLAEAGILEHIMSRTRFILLERDDTLGQAISYALALGSGQWTSAHEADPVPAEVPFSADVIRNFIDGVALETGMFRRFFGLNGVVPLRIGYETLDALPADTITRIGAWLGVPDLRFVADAIRLGRQGNTTNLIWREKFLST